MGPKLVEAGQARRRRGMTWHLHRRLLFDRARGISHVVDVNSLRRNSGGQRADLGSGSTSSCPRRETTGRAEAAEDLSASIVACSRLLQVSGQPSFPSEPRHGTIMQDKLF